MQVKRHAAAVIAITFILAEAAATARADISKGPNGGGSSSDTCAFGALTVSRGGGGTDVTTSISCSETSTKTTSGKISGSDWTPPKCWWEEITQDKFMKDYMNFSAMLHRTGTDRDDPEYVSKFHAYYKNFHDGDPGNWLQGYCEADATPDDYTTLGWDNLPGLWVWSPPGVPSPVGTAPTVTTETLAEIAAGKMPIPNTKISMSPSQPNDPTLPAASDVNLPTWLWLDPKQFATQSMTASLKQFNLSATVTAVPEELDVTVDGGARFSTTGAQGQPASELVCKAKADGSIGTPYVASAGAGSSSDCSITFLAPTPPNSSFTLHAKVVWKVTWTAGTAAAGWPKTEYLTEDVPNIVVREIQSANG